MTGPGRRDEADLSGAARGPCLFLLALTAVCAQLLLALLLSLKAWSHMVYVVVGFALLGYGVGSTVFLVRGAPKVRVRTVLAFSFAFVGLALLAATFAVLRLPLELAMVTRGGGMSLIVLYLAVALPFAGVGYATSYLFAADTRGIGRLYFWDLLGAATAAVLFLPLATIGPWRGVAFLAALCGLACAWLSLERRMIAVVLAAISCGVAGLPEPAVRIDASFGWEWIPGHFREGIAWTQVARSWHAMGRTDLHRIDLPEARARVIAESPGTFELPLEPSPPFAYFTNNYRAGTPVFALSSAALAVAGSELRPFSVAMEVPYVLVDAPKVLVIGAGGGRDVFTARVHGASSILGAEINPGTWREMVEGGWGWEYSGRLFGQEGIDIRNVDGSHLVKVQPEESVDLLVLNGVDTFAALATGEYSFAENYLYTREAVTDYLRVLSDSGIINFNRWMEHAGALPRESLRMFVMTLDALREIDPERPTDHVILGRHGDWGILLVKKSRFTAEEEARVLDYFAAHDTAAVFAPFQSALDEKNFYSYYAAQLLAGKQAAFIAEYPADISPPTDDSPFFYKYYRYTSVPTWGPQGRPDHPGMGSAVFRVQGLIVRNTLAFIVLFILVPLLIFRRRGLQVLRPVARVPFVMFFGAIGLAYILVEITLMQWFTLALGSPLRSIPVTLASLLAATGVGSLCSSWLSQRLGSARRAILCATGLALIALGAMSVAGGSVIEWAIGLSFGLRVATTAVLTAPIGFLLGVFFPLGLRSVGECERPTVAWAYGINSGFTVLGSTVSIVVAQFSGFSAVLGIAAALYVVACLCFWWMSVALAEPPRGLEGAHA